MTENKRFTLAYADYNWWAICDKKNPTELGISGEEVVKLLNELHEENKELQRHLDVMRSGALTDDKRIKELYDENKQFVTKCHNLEEENEQLKQQIKELELLNDSLIYALKYIRKIDVEIDVGDV